MIKKIFFIIALSAFQLSASAQDSMITLKLKITDEFSRHKGIYAVSFKDLSTNKELYINEKDIFHAASTMKTPVMIEVFKQVNQGKFALTDSIVLKNEFKSIVDGSTFRLDSLVEDERVLYSNLGKKFAIKDLVYEMITVSSNFATNVLIELVGAKNVTQSMRDLGAKDIKVLRGVEDTKAFDKGLNNTTTAFDLMLIFQNLAEGKVINQKSCDEMIKILLAQKFNTAIPAKLPADVKVAHKTGAYGKVRHDSGIVFLPDGRKYVLVLMSREWEDEKENIEILSNVSKLIYDAVK